MQKAIQKRKLKTRARLFAAAEDVIERNGYEALRVEEVVQAAGVAKGTFFAHFRDKDALMEILIGQKLVDCFDSVEQGPTPTTVPDIINALAPIHAFMTSERYVFDLILRYSGATAIAEIGPIAMCFERYVRMVAKWLEHAQVRRDVSPDLLADGVQAFAIQSMSLTYCALHTSQSFQNRLEIYLKAWLTPTG